MSAVNFDLQPGWLRRHEEKFFEPGARLFCVPVGGERFWLKVKRQPESSVDAYAHAPQAPEPPSDAEILLLIAGAFLGSLPVHPQEDVDLEEGWNEFRREMLETNSARFCPPWHETDPQIREAFALGVRAAMERGAR